MNPANANANGAEADSERRPYAHNSAAVATLPQSSAPFGCLRPPQVRPVPKLAEKEEKEEEDDASIPGSTYVKLMACTPLPVIPGELQCAPVWRRPVQSSHQPLPLSSSPGFELFLTALVKEEMSQMPRGLHFSALRGASLASARGKTVSGIPAFMLKTYEKNKQPGLKSGLAGDLYLQV